MAGPEEPPAPSLRAVGPPPEPSTIILVISGPIARGDASWLCEQVRVLLERSDASQVICDVGELVDPDAETVDALARVQLTARRLGHRVRLRNACGDLQDLLALTGLQDVVPCAESRLQPRGEAEERKQGLGVQEEADPTDPAA